ncbi:5-carboxymethyl-2-hydroxymuconate Delta-isomerase [Bacillus sp. FJAT-50079]|uniref:5-carboxymethyl-2-hydroxymuconate Delta-isomerase n=1 Tax=Bacillus sp. FJAT-50079 TaxID=2833577 RepID=UPI001BC94504|nr:5-carboxymethyl-2-hydroxymuconate Delta-isomerase [Bacillus sp. FJAT-50079]MBS4210262.1 5-carboxymethyl-2-hydroxymuconate Delta-isomerase [Bacillus sp. FJAT-50079]
MPHIIVEYTSNIKSEAEIHRLLKKINLSLFSHGNLFPIGGIRTRAIELHDYVIADGSEDDAFVHITLKIGAGRTEEEKKHVCDRLFEVVKEHFRPLFKKRFIALSLELYEFSEAGTYKWNNIHTRFKNN